MKTEQGYKFYTWVNTLYMRPIQFGIQSGHLSDEMTCKYLLDPQADPEARDHFTKWITSADPLYIVGDGSHMERIQEINDQLQLAAEILHLPQAPFYESAAALGGIMTVTGVVVPKSIWDRANFIRTSILSDRSGDKVDTWLPEYEAYMFVPLPTLVLTMESIRNGSDPGQWGWDMEKAATALLHRLCASSKRAM